MNTALPVLLAITNYFTFSNEINLYFENWFNNSTIQTNVTDTFNSSIHKNYFITIINMYLLMGYSLLFFGLLSIVNTSKIRNKNLGIIAIIFTLISLFVS